MLIDVLRPMLWPPMIALAFALCSEPGISQTANTGSLLEQGNHAMRRGDVTEAIRDFTDFTHSSPNSAVGYFNLGLALEQAGHLEESLKALRKAQALQPALRGVQMFTGIVNYKLNRLSDAHDVLLHASQLEPKNAAVWMWLGIVELAQGQAELAVTALDKASQLDPSNVDILYHRGRAHLLVSKESYSAMFKLDPNSWRVHEVVGQSDAEAFRFDNAISEFLLAVNAAPHEPGLHEELGDAYWQAYKLQEADDAYGEEIKIDPANTAALYKLGSLRVTRNDAASGVPLLQQALAADPTLTDAYYYLGKGEVVLGKDEAAIEQFRLATVDKNAEELRIMSWYQLAMLYRKLHRSQEAGEAMTRFRQMKTARDQRQENNFQEQGRRRGQLPVQEAIPAETAAPASP
jgi:tetratricopeptide (TPR) repeat protein